MGKFLRARSGRRRIATVATAVVVAALIITVEVAQPPRADAAIGAIVWQDEFNGAANTPPDPSKWRYDIGGHGWGNNELQYYTSSVSNAAHNGQGQMVITARRENPANYQCHYGRCQYTSARLLTQGRYANTYGRYEARIKIPRGQGMWPAFWMIGDNFGSVGWPASGEIDIMENIGREPNTVHGSLHAPGYSGANSVTAAYNLSGGAAFTDAYHTFRVDWEPNAITFFVDGVSYARLTPADTRGNAWIFDHPFFLILNVAVGGYWPGEPDGSTMFPQQMLIDWVRVSQWVPGAAPSGDRVGPITGYFGKCVDVAGGNSANGTPIVMNACNGSRGQRWTMAADGTFRAFGKCLDVSGGSSANGARLVLGRAMARTTSGSPTRPARTS